tara:strand:- start:1313 stop:1981 length:669 start_codon:yes stop_codon:yes gene_type:complete
MKKILLVFFLVFSPNILCSQELILKAGISFFTLKSNDIINYDQSRDPLIPGYFSSISCSYDLNDKFSISLDCVYSKKGVSFTQNNVGVSYSQSVVKNSVLMNYLDLSPYVTYKFNEEYSLTLGIFSGYMLSLLEIVETDDAIVEDYYGYNNVDNKLDFGLQFGPTILISNNLSIDFLYKFGFTNIGDASIVNKNLRHRSLNIGLSFVLFNMKTNKSNNEIKK